MYLPGVVVNKKKTKAEFEALGLWKHFVHYREWLVACGIARPEAWEQAVDVAHRLVERFGAEVAGASLVGMVKGEECPLDTEPEVVPAAPAEVVEEPLTFQGVPLEYNKRLVTEADVDAVLADVGLTPTTDAPPLKTPRAPRPPHVPARPSAGSSELPENVARSRFYKPSASPREAVEWVAANIAVSDVEPEDCPGPEAWGLLCWARKNEGNLNTFWTSHYPKLMPSKSENENAGRRRDNADAIEELIVAVEHAGREAVANPN